MSSTTFTTKQYSSSRLGLFEILIVASVVAIFLLTCLVILITTKNPPYGLVVIGVVAFAVIVGAALLATETEHEDVAENTALDVERATGLSKVNFTSPRARGSFFKECVKGANATTKVEYRANDSPGSINLAPLDCKLLDIEDK